MNKKGREVEEIGSFRVLRSAAFLIMASVLIGVSADSLVRAQTAQQEAITAEHRFTQLETTVQSIALDVHDLRQYNWIALLGMAGLLGEAGIRTLKKRKEDAE